MVAEIDRKLALFSFSIYAFLVVLLLAYVTFVLRRNVCFRRRLVEAVAVPEAAVSEPLERIRERGSLHAASFLVTHAAAVARGARRQRYDFVGQYSLLGVRHFHVDVLVVSHDQPGFPCKDGRRRSWIMGDCRVACYLVVCGYETQYCLFDLVDKLASMVRALRVAESSKNEVLHLWLGTITVRGLRQIATEANARFMLLSLARSYIANMHYSDAVSVSLLSEQARDRPVVEWAKDDVKVG